MADKDSQLKIYKKGWLAAALFFIYVVVGITLVSKGPHGDFYPFSSWDLFSEAYGKPYFFDLEFSDGKNRFYLTQFRSHKLDRNLLWFLSQQTGRDVDKDCNVPTDSEAGNRLAFELSKDKDFSVKFVRFSGNFYEYITSRKYEFKTDCLTLK